MEVFCYTVFLTAFTFSFIVSAILCINCSAVFTGMWSCTVSRSTFHRPRPKSSCRKKAILIYEYIYLKCAMFKSNYDTSMRPYIYGYVFFSLCIQNVKSILFILLIIQDIFTLGPTFFVLICQFCTVLDILYCLY